jgi:hypothetical protein
MKIQWMKSTATTVSVIGVQKDFTGSTAKYSLKPYVSGSGKTTDGLG